MPTQEQLDKVYADYDAEFNRRCDLQRQLDYLVTRDTFNALQLLADEHGRTVKEELAYLVANASLKVSIKKNQFGTIVKEEPK